MLKNEKEFLDFVGDITFDDTPDPDHRNRLEQRLRAALAKKQLRARQSGPAQTNWRKIMKSKYIKLAAAAAVLLIALALGEIFTSSTGTNSITAFSLLTRTCAAEQSMFMGEGIVHIVNEITIYPTGSDDRTANLLDQLVREFESEDDVESLSALNKEFLNSWLSAWSIPISFLSASGEFRYYELKLAPDSAESFKIYDHAWYEPQTGRFCRMMRSDEKVLFANGYDGEYVYLCEPTAVGNLRQTKEYISEKFYPPRNPAEFLGITAGVRSFVTRESNLPVQEITSGSLPDGTVVHIYKSGFADLDGNVNTYNLFKVRDDDDTVAEIEFVAYGQVQQVIRRITVETVDQPEISWDLSQISTQLVAVSEDNPLIVEQEMMLDDVSVRHLAEEADFATYIFAVDPAWTGTRTIAEIPDIGSPGRHMYIIIYPAENDRHVMLIQSATHNAYFSAVFRKLEELQKQLSPDYTSDNGFKVYGSTDGAQKWWTEFSLQSAGFTPAPDRCGYFMQSPEGTYPLMVVNGRVTEQELHSLVDSLVPTSELIEQ